MSMFKLSVAVVVMGALMVGCASKAKETGFLSSYKNLEPKSSTELVYVGTDLKNYNKFMIDPIVIKIYDPKNAGKVTPEDAAHFKSFFYAQLRKDMAGKFEVVPDPGPGVARLRIAVTDIKAGTPALNVIPQTKLTGVGLGAASGECEIVDSQTGEQLAAAVISQTGSRLSLSGLSKWGDAEAVMKDWSKRIVERISEAHGKAAK